LGQFGTFWMTMWTCLRFPPNFCPTLNEKQESHISTCQDLHEMLFSYADGVLSNELVPQGQTVNQHCCIVTLQHPRKMCSKNDLLGGIYGECLVSSQWQCTCHFVLSVHEFLVKENYPFTALHLTRFSAIWLLPFLKTQDGINEKEV
jgi:hypothetical protein